MRKLFFLLITLLSTSAAIAQHVTEADALLKAQAFMKERIEATGSSHRAPRKMQPVSKATENDAFYIFNAEDNGGFVIVSGDERLPAVLGYSLTGCYDSENVPANMQSWLNGYVEQVKYVQTHDGTRLSKRRSITGPAISPLLDCEWDQYAPYNGNCPVVFDVQSPAGCVATAMAQIMYYYQWPQQTRKVVPGYMIYDNGVTISDIPVTTINWDNILPKYDYDGSYSAEQVDAIAQLMQLCGTSVRMRYDASESSATMTRVTKSFPRYFGYSTDISLAYAADYESDAWEQLMYDELAASRPIMYSGSGESGGHTFIVDGYDENDYFHINWGWGGSDNGYFLLPVLPDYNINQCAVIGIQPSATSIPDAYGVLENGTMTLYYDTKMNERSGQIFDNLVSDAFFDIIPLEIEVLCCPAEESMTQCVIDPSFAAYDLETLYCFFYQCENLKSITGLKYLNTSNVNNMAGMFFRCSSLEAVDFKNFRAESITDMGWMFRDCIALKNLDLSNMNTENVFSMEGMFYGCSSLESVDLSSFNVEKTQFMDWMFVNCSSLKSLDLSSFNTKSLLTLYSTFEGCSSLTDLDISNFQTDNVVDMAYTFRYCSSLKNLNLSHFNTEKVTQMSAMFEGCTVLESLDVSNFNTENVIRIHNMFSQCYSLKNLDVSSFNTKNVIAMPGLFSNCYALDYLDLHGFHTENTTDMSCMFACCSSLKSIDVSNFNTSNVVDMYCMFSGCNSLKTLDLSNFNTDNVTNMYAMFQGCSGLTSLDVSGFKTNNVTSMSVMFEGCSGLTSLDVSGFETNNVTDMNTMFSGCSGLTSLDVSGFKTNNVTNMSVMFEGCSGLTSLDVSGFKTDNVTDMRYMFEGCSGLTSLDVSGFKTDNVTNMFGMFQGCSGMTSLDLSGFKTDNVTDMSVMFEGCSGLTSLDVSGFMTDNVTDMSSMFSGCSCLTSLDLSNFKTLNVTNVTCLFADCISLETIYVGDGWNTDGITEMESNGDYLFGGCENLVGGKGTKWSYEHQNIDYAHIDGGPEAPGYFTDKNAAAYTMGDANGDGTVSVTDVTMTISHILGQTPEGFDAEAADVNGDGSISVTDVTILIDMILNQK